jgi:uncharacterized protein (DUF2147 family)
MKATETMKQFFLVFTILSSLKTFSQKEADAIIGKWITTPGQTTIIRVSKINNEYEGKIIWAKDNDPKKPIGFIILEKLKYNSKRKIWEHGKIHDPNSGKTYDAIARIKDDGILELHGYLGFRFLGRKKNFARVK